MTNPQRKAKQKRQRAKAWCCIKNGRLLVVTTDRTESLAKGHAANIFEEYNLKAVPVELREVKK